MQTRAALARKNSHSLLTAGLDEQEAAEGNIELLYFTGWKSPAIHYRILDTEVWTDLPGEKFTEQNGGFFISIPGKGIEFVCNDGVPTGWDKAPGNQNYYIRKPGKYTLKNGTIEQQLSPPKPPTLVVATEVGSTTVCLSWNPPDGMPESEIGGYWIYRNDVVVHKLGVTRNLKDEKLKGAVEYKYEVSAVNVQGTESEKCDAIIVKTNVPGKPGPPAWLKVAATSPNFIELTWKPPMDLGGASVTAYSIYRSLQSQPEATAECVGTVISRDADGQDKTELSWKDTEVKQGESYSYQVSAIHLADGTMARTVSQAELVEEIKRKASNSLLSVEDGENEGPRCEAVVAKAQAMLKAPRLDDKDPHIMLQAFNWDSCYNKDGWYKVLSGQVPDMKEAGIDMVWLPPPSQCVDDRGYLPGRWYDLNSKYGTAEQLKSLISSMHESGISPIADIVINHRCAQEKDQDGKWTVFKQPDWERWAICRNDPSGLGQGAESTGQNIEYAPDIDHTNKKIQEDSKAYMKWLIEEIGFRAIRLDFVLGYGAWIQEQYVRSVGSPYAVAEYWHGDVQVLRNYINATKGVTAVYDFPVYYTLKNAIHSNDFGGLNCGGRLPGVMGSDPIRSVTFVENHDTCHLEVVGGKFGDNNQVCRAYAFLLTHCGVPSIFWSDWSDRGPQVRKELKALCQVRKSVGVHATSRVNIVASQWGLYAAYIDGTKGTIAFKMGGNDWSPGGGWAFKASGNDYAVWTKGGE